MNFQFFDRPAKNKMNKRDNDCDIKYIPNIEYDINYQVDLDDIGILNYFYRSRYGQTYKAKEINEDIFYHYFDEEIRKNKILNNRTKKLAITTYEVYSQIISIIKGSYSSYLSYSNSITREQYKVLGKKITMFTEEQKDEIYNYYIKYEKWKKENNYFDFQDVKKVTVVTRASILGHFEIKTQWDGPVLGTIEIKDTSNFWEEHSAEINLPNGVSAFYIKYIELFPMGSHGQLKSIKFE